MIELKIARANDGDLCELRSGMFLFRHGPCGVFADYRIAALAVLGPNSQAVCTTHLAPAVDMLFKD